MADITNSESIKKTAENIFTNFNMNLHNLIEFLDLHIEDYSLKISNTNKPSTVTILELHKLIELKKDLCNMQRKYLNEIMNQHPFHTD